MVKRDDLIKGILSSYDSERCALFIGAGMSTQAGYPTWRQLLNDIGDELGLPVEGETDLAALAQYYLNENPHSTKLRDKIVEELGPDKPIPGSLRILARLPVRSIWTTNYDRLIERAWDEQLRPLDVKFENDHVPLVVPGKAGVLYKMHGSVDLPTHVILAKDDYELFVRTRGPFRQILAGDYIAKTFLFVGLSFEDPSLHYVFSMVRMMFHERNGPNHWTILKKPSEGDHTKADFPLAKRRHELRIRDLERYGIKTLEVDSFEEVNSVLQTLLSAYQRRSVFVSGSFPAAGDPTERVSIEDISSRVGSLLIQMGLTLVSGFGITVGNAALVGAMERAQRQGLGFDDQRIRLLPFPQPTSGNPTPDWTAHRQQIADNAGICVVIAGAKSDSLAEGVRAEASLFIKASKPVVPIGITGYVAKELWNEMLKDPDKFGLGTIKADHLKALGSNDGAIDALEAILRALQKA